MTDEIIGELSGEEIDRVDALARQRGLARDAMIAELVNAGMPAEEARAAGKDSGNRSVP